MSNQIEIELRYEILDIKELYSFLAGTQQLHKKHDVDVYLDTPERILWQRGIFIRIRNNKKLDIKFNRACLDNPHIDRIDYCEEHSFALPLNHDDLQKLNTLLASLNLKTIAQADLKTLIKTNNLDTHYVVDKVRTSYVYQAFTIAIDEVKDLGTFLEIELMTQNAHDFEQVKNNMRIALAGLKLQPLRLGYCAQLLKKYDFTCYQRGRYALKEDLI